MWSKRRTFTFLPKGLSTIRARQRTAPSHEEPAMKIESPLAHQESTEAQAAASQKQEWETPSLTALDLDESESGPLSHTIEHGCLFPASD